MRRGVTVLVVVVVTAIAVAAGIDALRGGSKAGPEARSVSTGTGSEGPTNYVPLEDDEAAGTLYYTEGNCELEAIELPGRTPAEVPDWEECRFVLSPDATSVSAAGTAWDPTGDHLFHAKDGRIVVLSSDHEPEGSFPGTAAAWRPDGTLTYVADGTVLTWPEGRALLTQDDLAEAVRAHPDVPDNGHVRPVVVRELAWIDDHRAVVILDGVIRGGPPESILGFFDGRRLMSMRSEDGVRYSELRVSPGGGYVAIRSGESLLMLDMTGDPLAAPTLAGVRAIAWSPDEQHVAVAADQRVVVFRVGDFGTPALQLDLDAHDLTWRGDAGVPVPSGGDEARTWLGDAGATGRLFVTQATGSACTLRALQLPDLTWAERPPGLPNPCRFALDASGSVLPGSPVPRPGRIESALCHQGALEWFYHSTLRARYPGACAPAWMPDGGLTFVRDGSLYQASWPDRGSRRLLSRSNVGKMLGRPSAIEEVAWVDARRFWAVVRSGESAIVALMTTDRLVSAPSFTTRAIEGLRVSASGMVAARIDQGVVFFDTGGRRALTVRNGQAVSWAPGEPIAAVATPSEILFVAPVSGEIVTLPLAVRDLEWVIP